MAQYIDKDEKVLFTVEKQIEQYESLISFLDTIEVKEDIK